MTARAAIAEKARAACRRLAGLPVLRAYYEAATRPGKGGDAMLAAVAALLAFAALASHVGGMYDYDGWFLLSTGREILEGGIPNENPFSQEPGLGMVVQQWAHDAYLAAAYGLGGFTGAEVAMALPVGLAAAGAWLLAGALSERPARPVLRALSASAALWMCSTYFSVRPTSWSMALFAAAVLACAKGRENPEAYAALPPIAALWVNLQAALWPLVLFAGACFLLPRCRAEIAGGARKWLGDRKWLLAAMAASCAASLLNPYGLKGSLYSLLSMGAASYGGAILEMKSPFSTLAPAEVVAVSLGMLLPFLLCRSKRRKLPAAAAAMLLVSLAAFLLCVRNIWILGLSFAFAMSAAIAPAEPGETADAPSPCPRDGTGHDAADAERTANAAKAGGLSGRTVRMAWAAAVCLGFCCSIALGLSGVGDATRPDMAQDRTGMAALSSWEAGTSQIGPIADAAREWGEANGAANPRIATTVDAATSVLEWHGVAVPFDLRPEIWDSAAITGKPGFHPWADFVDGVCSGDGRAERRYVEGGGWDLIVCQNARAGELEERYGLEEVASTEGFSLLAMPGGRQAAGD